MAATEPQQISESTTPHDVVAFLRLKWKEGPEDERNNMNDLIIRHDVNGKMLLAYSENKLSELFGVSVFRGPLLYRLLHPAARHDDPERETSSSKPNVQQHTQQTDEEKDETVEDAAYKVILVVTLACPEYKNGRRLYHHLQKALRHGFGCLAAYVNIKTLQEEPEVLMLVRMSGTVVGPYESLSEEIIEARLQEYLVSDVGIAVSHFAFFRDQTVEEVAGGRECVLRRFSENQRDAAAIMREYLGMHVALDFKRGIDIGERHPSTSELYRGLWSRNHSLNAWLVELIWSGINWHGIGKFATAKPDLVFPSHMMACFASFECPFDRVFFDAMKAMSKNHDLVIAVRWAGTQDDRMNIETIVQGKFERVNDFVAALGTLTGTKIEHGWIRSCPMLFENRFFIDFEPEGMVDEEMKLLFNHEPLSLSELIRYSNWPKQIGQLGVRGSASNISDRLSLR